MSEKQILIAILIVVAIGSMIITEILGMRKRKARQALVDARYYMGRVLIKLDLLGNGTTYQRNYRKGLGPRK